MEEFDRQDSFKFFLELILSLLSVISLVCACSLTRAIARTRNIAQQQAKLVQKMDISMDHLLNNSADYALTEFVIFMSISDIFRSLIKTFRHLRSAFGLWTLCNIDSLSGVICLGEDFITWSLISNDIICYGIICYCLFRYLRKRSIFTQRSITPPRIYCGIIVLSVVHSSIQLVLVVFYYRNHFNYEIIYVPTLIILYCTVFYILTVFAYIRCCHPFWVLSKSKTSLYLFLAVFTVIFIVPITLKIILAILPSNNVNLILLFIADALLTQTGTGNCFAWYYSQKEHIAEMRHHEKLFHNEESVELSSNIEYVIDVKELTKNKNRKTVHSPKKKSTLLSMFSLPTNHSTNGTSSGDENINETLPNDYKPPKLTMSIDVMAMEPVRSNKSSIDESFSSVQMNEYCVQSTMDQYLTQNMEQYIKMEEHNAQNEQ